MSSNSNSLCKARFHHLSLNLVSGKGSNCCHLPERKLNLNDRLIDQTPQEILSLRDMASGLRPKECASSCWSVEDKNLLSTRQKWALTHPVLKNKNDQNYISENVDSLRTSEWLNLKITNTCQFRCLYCSNQHSSSWNKEFKIHGYFDNIDGHHFNATEDERPKVNYIDTILENLKNISQIDITGGEPLLSDDLYKILNHLSQVELEKKMSLVIVTNLSCNENLWNKFIVLLKKVENNENLNIIVMPSIDAWGQRAEYIRNGLKFDLFYARLHFILLNTKVHLRLSITSNALSVSSFPKMIHWLCQLKENFQTKMRAISFRLDHVSGPHYLKTDIVHIEDKYNYVQTVHNHDESIEKLFTPLEVNVVKNMLDFYVNHSVLNPERVRQFKSFLQQVDVRFNVSSKDIFSEIKFTADHCLLNFNDFNLQKDCYES